MHPSVDAVIQKFEALELHAARSGREVMAALAHVARHSAATDTATLGAEIEEAIDAILEVMPTYAPPINVMHRILAHVENALAEQQSATVLRSAVIHEAAAFQAWAGTAYNAVARNGAALIHDGTTVFTYTLSETALRTLREAHLQRKTFSVLVTESRPNNDGLVTVRELSEEGIPVSVSIDACIGELIPQADLMIVGAEAIEPDGSAICKVGTYPAALVARAYSVPVYVVVDTFKFDVSSLAGLSLTPISRDDVLLDARDRHATVIGHLFDRTPGSLITGIVTERGVIHPQACGALMLQMQVSRTLTERFNRAKSKNNSKVLVANP